MELRNSKKLMNSKNGIIFKFDVDPLNLAAGKFNKKYVAIMKIEPVNLYDFKDYQYYSERNYIDRQLVFNKFIQTAPNNIKKHFLTVISYGFYLKESNVSYVSEPLNDKIKQKLNSYQKMYVDSDLFYILCTPYLDVTWEANFKKNVTNKNILTKMFNDIYPAIKYINLNGWRHGDIHSNNIMYSKEYDRWYLIDYSTIRHKSFKIHPNDFDIVSATFGNYDYLQFIKHLFYIPLFEHMFGKNIKIYAANDDVVVKLFKKDKEYNTIKKYIPNGMAAKDLINYEILLMIIFFYDKWLEYSKIKVTDGKIDKKIINANLVCGDVNLLINVLTDFKNDYKKLIWDTSD